MGGYEINRQTLTDIAVIVAILTGLLALARILRHHILRPFIWFWRQMWRGPDGTDNGPTARLVKHIRQELMPEFYAIHRRINRLHPEDRNPPENSKVARRIRLHQEDPPPKDGPECPT